MNRIREMRKMAGMSVERLAQMAHITIASVYRYERGDRIPNIATASAIAAALGCTIDELVTGKTREYCEKRLQCDPELRYATFTGMVQALADIYRHGLKSAEEAMASICEASDIMEALMDEDRKEA